MQPFPPLPDAADVTTDLFDHGHLWIMEWVTGAPVRFQVDETGILLGDDEHIFEPWDEPLGYRHVARHLRERVDATTFLSEVSNPSDHVFYGIATRDEGISYEWERLPSFLGQDIYSPGQGLLAPDTVERAFDRLGLDLLNVLQKEVAARDFHLDRFETPDSAWYDGPAAGVLAVNKRRERALIRNPNCKTASQPSQTPTVETLVESFVTPERLERLVDKSSGPNKISVDQVLDRLVETLARERYQTVFAAGGFDAGAFRGAAAEHVIRQIGQ